MRVLTSLAAALALLSAPVAFAQTTPVPQAVPKAVEVVAKAERDFDADTAVHGITRGFHTWSTQGAVAFRPAPVDIHAKLEEKLKANPEGFDAPSKLRWGPWRIGVAGSGDFAYDIGTWHQEGTPNQGWFFTLWLKLPDGNWRWALDTGAGAAPAGETPDPAKALLIDPLPRGKRASSPFQAHADVVKVDTTLNDKLVAGKDNAGPYKKYSLATAAFVRTTGAPQSPAEAASMAWKERPAGSWHTDTVRMARSGDMACIQGDVSKDGTVVGYYVRVWVKDGDGARDWKLAVDLYQPLG